MNTFGTTNKDNREFWIEKKLKEIPSGLRILDAGAGEQVHKKWCSHLNYVSQDFGKYDGAGNNKALQNKEWDYANLDIVSDITNIPEPDNSFDAILCTEVLEHVPKPVNAIIEFNRLLKKNGILIITAPFCSLTHQAPYHYYSGYNKYFYTKTLTEQGFKIVEILANGNYFEYIAQEIYRIPSIAKNYSDFKGSTLLMRTLLKIIIKYLEKLASADKGSDELLCFGYHILAVKM